MTAFITIDADNDLPSIALAAGQSDESKRYYMQGCLYVEDVEQAALDAAFAAYDSSVYEKAAKLSSIAAKRFEAESGGVTVSSVGVYSDRETRSLIDQTIQYMDDDEIVSWKTTSGEFVPLTKDALREIAKSLFKYVQACFAREGELVTAVSSGTFTDALLDEGWPSQEITP